MEGTYLVLIYEICITRSNTYYIGIETLLDRSSLDAIYSNSKEHGSFKSGKKKVW